MRIWVEDPSIPEFIGNPTQGDLKMKKAITRCITGLALIGSLTLGHAADMTELAKAKECFTCHATTATMPKAPSFQDIAKKHKGLAEARNMLAEKVKVGGSGHWGASPMPASGGARVEVSDDEARALAGWILDMH